MAVRPYILSLERKKQPPQQPPVSKYTEAQPSVAPTDRPVALDELLKMARTTSVTDATTEERPLGGAGALAELPNIKGEIGMEALPSDFKYDEKKQEQASLDLLKTQFGYSDKDIGMMKSEKTGTEIVRIVGELLVLKGLPTATMGVRALTPAAAGRTGVTEIGGEILKTATSQPVAQKILAQIGKGALIPIAYLESVPLRLARAEFEALLDTGLDKWVASVGRTPEAQSALTEFIVGKRTRFIEYATKNWEKRLAEMKAGRGTPQTVRAAVDDTIKDVEKNILPEFSRTRTDLTVSKIKAGEYQPAPSIQAVKGVTAELKPAPQKELIELVDIDTKSRVIRYPKGGQIIHTYSKDFNYKEALETLNDRLQRTPLEKELIPLKQALTTVPQPPVQGVTPVEIMARPPRTDQIGSTMKPVPEVVRDIGGFEKTLSPANSAKAIEQMNMKKVIAGKSQSRKEYIEDAVLKGATVGVKEGKPALTFPDGRYIRQSEITKTALDYANYLNAKQTVAPQVTPTPTAPTIGVTPVEAVGEAVPPTIPPPPPETGITPEMPISDKATFANLQDIQTVVDYSNKPDVSRWIANLPAVKQVMSKMNLSAIANTPGEKAIIARAVLREEGTQKAKGINSYRDAVGNEKDLFGRDDKGFMTENNVKGLTLGDIIQSPSKIKGKLTPSQQTFINRAKEISRAKLKYLRDNDIEVNELTFEEGGEYADRRVFALMSADGELLDTAFVGAGPSRIGKKLTSEKKRVFNTEADAIAAGYYYLPFSEAQSLNVRAAYNRVADKKMSEWLLTQVPWRTTGAPEELVLAAESAKTRVNSSKQLLAALNRAVRGERVPDATLNSIARTYPAEAAELKSLIPELQDGKPTASRVQALDKKAKALIKSDNKDKWAAINARARAREKAMTPKFKGEATIPHPAFAGKIFTGSEAKKLAETMRNALEPKVSQALTSVNKVNALVRYFKLAGDFSPFLIQLIFLAGQNPKIYGGAAASIPKFLFDKEWSAKFLSEHKNTIDRHPGLLLSSLGTEFTEAMAKGGLLSSRVNVWPKQEGLAKKLALATPRAVGKGAATVLQPFQRVFEDSIDYAGIKMAESLEHLAKTPAEMAEIDQFINEFRGLTSSAKLGVTANWRAGETAAILAPRYNRAIAALLYDAIKGAVSFGQSGLRNRLAIQGLTKGIAAISAITVALSLALGEDEDEIKEHFDPLSSKFLTWNVAGQNIGPGSKVRSVVKLLAQVADNPEALLQLSMDNPALRFIRGNLAPVPGGAISILTGKDYIGDPVRSDTATFTREMIVKNFMPIWVENVIYEGGSLSQRLIRGAGEFFGGRAYPETESDEVNRLRDRYSAQEYGKKWEDLNNADRGIVREKYPSLVELEKTAKESYVEKGSDIEQFYYNEKQKITDNRNDRLEKAAQALIDGKISKSEYDDQRGYIRPYYSGGNETLWSAREKLDAYSVKQLEKWLDENIKPEDKALGEYQEYRGELIEGSDLPTDWDSIDRELESYLNKYSPEVEAYILANMDAWIKGLPPAAKQIEMQRAKGMDNETWWEDYREAIKMNTSRTPAISGASARPYKLSLEK